LGFLLFRFTDHGTFENIGRTALLDVATGLRFTESHPDPDGNIHRGPARLATLRSNSAFTLTKSRGKVSRSQSARPQRTQRTKREMAPELTGVPVPAPPQLKSTYHGQSPGREPAAASGDADQKKSEGVEGKYVELMLGLDCPKSTMDTSSMIDGRRQSL
jgi:hypothetical protein